MDVSTQGSVESQPDLNCQDPEGCGQKSVQIICSHGWSILNWFYVEAAGMVGNLHVWVKQTNTVTKKNRHDEISTDTDTSVDLLF